MVEALSHVGKVEQRPEWIDLFLDYFDGNYL